MPRSPLTGAMVRQAAAMARYDLSEARAAELAPHLQGMLQALDGLDAVDLGETPPANAFDARWGEKTA